VFARYKMENLGFLAFEKSEKDAKAQAHDVHCPFLGV
jgi:hypothetical protein